MLVFIDESGDPGFDLDGGASEFFVVTSVAFQEESHAIACCKHIDFLRKDAGLPPKVELHFAKSSKKVRRSVLRGVAPFNFFYRALVIDKKMLDPAVVPYTKEDFYQYVVSFALESWRQSLTGAEVDIDQAGGESFSRRLRKYISQSFKDRKGKPLLKRIRACDSRKSNLLQLADMICGAVTRSFKDGQGTKSEFRQLIRAREVEVIVRP